MAECLTIGSQGLGCHQTNACTTSSDLDRFGLKLAIQLEDDTEIQDRSEGLSGSKVDLVLPQHVMRQTLDTEVLRGKQSLLKGAYKADIVLDRKDILNLELMRGCHIKVMYFC